MLLPCFPSDCPQMALELQEVICSCTRGNIAMVEQGVLCPWSCSTWLGDVLFTEVFSVLLWNPECDLQIWFDLVWFWFCSCSRIFSLLPVVGLILLKHRSTHSSRDRIRESYLKSFSHLRALFKGHKHVSLTELCHMHSWRRNKKN